MEQSLLFFGLAVLTLSASVNARADWIADLHSPDVALRREAIFRIQTLDDPRVPAACLPLLNDTGLSIRRLAARAIGSRFYDISDADRPRYLAALQACLDSRKDEPDDGSYSGVDDVTLMCQRAISLLSRRYDSPPFSVSPNGKWVLYERRRRPVIAYIAKQQHHLITPLDPDGYQADEAYYSEDEDDANLPETNILKTVDTNLPADQLFAPHWRSNGEALAFSLERMQRRFYHPILVWSAASPSRVVVLDEAFFQNLLGTRYPQWGTTTDFVAWKGEKVLVRVYNCMYPEGDHPPDPGLIVSYNIRTGSILLDHLLKADPSLRHSVTVQLPTKLEIKRTQHSLSVGYTSLEAVELTVGLNMTEGLRDEERIYRNGDSSPETSYVSETDSIEIKSQPWNFTQVFKPGEGANFPQPGTEYDVERRLTLFETDEPPQHEWSPQSGKHYKELWTKTFKEHVK
jgi:hypothetical protein